jgi:beta-lactamase class A
MRIKLALTLLALSLASRLGATPVVLSASGVASAGVRPPDLGETQSKWSAMETAVRRNVTAFRGEVGLVIRDLATGWTLQINPDSAFPAASMVKVPIMAACLEAGREGRLSLEDRMTLKRSDKTTGSGLLRRNRSGSVFTVDRLVELMVAHSDNTATNMLIDRLGFDYLNEAFREMGLERTNLARKMMDFGSRGKGFENYTTAREMADVLERMYRRDCFSAEVSGMCLEYLKAQKVNDRIPRLLPRDTVVAHKTGLERQVCHDAGIVFTGRGDFLISVFTRTWSGKNYAKRLISGVAALAYKVYGPEPAKTTA